MIVCCGCSGGCVASPATASAAASDQRQWLFRRGRVSTTGGMRCRRFHLAARPHAKLLRTGLVLCEKEKRRSGGGLEQRQTDARALWVRAPQLSVCVDRRKWLFSRRVTFGVSPSCWITSWDGLNRGQSANNLHALFDLLLYFFLGGI